MTIRGYSDKFAQGVIEGQVKEIDRLHAVIAKGNIMSDECEKDAQRYRMLRSRVSGKYCADGRMRFELPLPKPLKNVMQGSVAQHFDDAIDAMKETS